MDKQKDSQLIKTLPSSISQDDRIQNLANAISNNMNVIEQIIPLDAIYANIDSIPKKLLDVLAWQFHADIYNDIADIEGKRALVKASIKYHRYKGTPYALMQAVTKVIPEAELLEWYEYQGNPYYFRLKTGPIGSKQEVAELINALRDAKNVRSWLDCVVSTSQDRSTLFTGQRVKYKKKLYIYPASNTDLTISQSGGIGEVCEIEKEIYITGGD